MKKEKEAKMIAPIAKLEAKAVKTSGGVQSTQQTTSAKRLSVDFTSLPDKYHRKPASSDELSAINVNNA